MRIFTLLVLLGPAACSLPTVAAPQEGEWNGGRISLGLGGSDLNAQSLFGIAELSADGYTALQADWEFGPAGTDTTVVAGVRYQGWDTQLGDLNAVSLLYTLRRYLDPVDTRGWNPYMSGGGEAGFLDGNVTGTGILWRFRGEAGLRYWMSRRVYLDVAADVGIDLSLASKSNLYGSDYGVLFGFGMYF